MGKWLKTIIALVVGVWLIRFPPTRALIIFLLPLGSGWDDVVAILFLVVATGIYIIKSTRYGSSKETRRKKRDDFFN